MSKYEETDIARVWYYRNSLSRDDTGDRGTPSPPCRQSVGVGAPSSACCFTASRPTVRRLRKDTSELWVFRVDWHREKKGERR